VFAYFRMLPAHLTINKQHATTVIRQLFIQDFALIDQLEVHFEQGLSILTGQTGAGKSIIVGALNVVLGERAEHDLIRTGATKAIVEAIFGLGKNKAILDVLKENELEHNDDTLILRREIRDYGSRAYINDQPVSVNVLRLVGDMLVDLHGQHEHQLLLREEHHRVFLDRFAQHQPLLQAYRKARSNALADRKALTDLLQRERDLRERLDINRFKLKELEDAQLKEGEDEELKTILHRLEHTEDLAAHTSAIVGIGAESEANIGDLLKLLIREIDAIAEIEPEFASFRAELEAARVSVQEAVRFAANYSDSIDFNPTHLETLRRRQAELNKLQKKYLADLEGLITLRENLRQELALTEGFDLEITKLEKRLVESMQDLRKSATELTASRTEAGKKLADRLLIELNELGMPHTQFKVFVEAGTIETAELSLFGDQGPGNTRFMIATNKGEELKPLSKVASGGEISRIMLGLKTVLALDDDMPVMIFDEIDTGISGKVSEMVGRSMKRLSRHCQILAITHQPQIAAQADHNYRVEKIEEADRTITHIRRLEGDERIREIAELMSGSTVTEAALTSAREMMRAID
jgi:DNA repair protein RecN (Recombination protein N)